MDYLISAMLGVVEGLQEAVEGCGEEEGEQDFGNEVAGEEEDAGGG